MDGQNNQQDTNKMAQSLLDALSAGVTNIDSQTALAVQTFLDSQSITVQDPNQGVDDGDVFQCGKCKRQFSSLPHFLNHKQMQCMVLDSGNNIVCSTRQQQQQQQPGNVHNNPRSCMDPVGSSNHNIVYTAHYGPVMSKQMNTFSGVQQLVPGMMLGDEIIFHTVDQGPSMSMENQYLSQLDQITVSLKSDASYGDNNSTFPVNNAEYASTMDGAQLQFLTSQQVGSNTDMQQVILLPPNNHSPVEKLFSASSENIMLNGSNADVKMITQMEASNRIAKDPEPVSLHRNKLTAAGSSSAPVVGAEDSVRKRLKCQYCEKTFLKNFDLQQHVRSHTGEKPFQCIVCGRAFAQKSNVKKHMQTHKVWPQGTSSTLPVTVTPLVSNHSEGSEGASGCQETGSDGGDVQNVVVMDALDNSHQLTLVSILKDSDFEKMDVIIDNSYICQYCDERFLSYFQLKSHMVVHKNEQVYKCVVNSCSECFRDLDIFLDHIKKHENQMSYRCNICNKQFPTLQELGTHQYSHSLYPNQGPKPGPKYFRCVKCNNKYATPAALQHHLETTSHTYSCTHCDKMFTCERYLRRHLPTHGTVGEYECNTCSKRFKTDHYLKVHMVVHSSEKPFRCETCQTSFNRKDKLRRHMLIHEPIKKFKCPFRAHSGCLKEFNRKDKLKAHVISHSGIKPYNCRTCDKMFTRRPHLREHERTHTLDFPFKCDKCCRGFIRSKVFKEHNCYCTDSTPEKKLTSLDGEKGTKQAESARRRPIRRRLVSSDKVPLLRRGRRLQTREEEMTNPEKASNDVCLDDVVSITPDNDTKNIIDIQTSNGEIGSIDTIRVLQDCMNGSLGNVLKFEQADDGTIYIVQSVFNRMQTNDSNNLSECSPASGYQTAVPVISQTLVDPSMSGSTAAILVGRSANEIDSKDGTTFLQGNNLGSNGESRFSFPGGPILFKLCQTKQK